MCDIGPLNLCLSSLKLAFDLDCITEREYRYYDRNLSEIK